MKFCWTTLHVTNIEKSLVFYQDFLKLPLLQRFRPSDGIEIAFLGKGETQVELIHYTEQQKVTPTSDISLGFEVSSLDDMEDRMKIFGYEKNSERIQPNPHLQFLFLQDPDGFTIQLVEKI